MNEKRSISEMTREEKVYLIQLAEKAEQWEDMLNFMREFLKDVTDLNPAEQTLFLSAYKISANNLRAEIRGLTAVEENLSSENINTDQLREIRNRLWVDLTALCKEANENIEKLLVPELDCRSEILYRKLKGDFIRYVLDNLKDHKEKTAEIKAMMDQYKRAIKMASPKNDFNPTDPLVLSVSINYAVALYEVSNTPHEAVSLLSNILNSAIQNIRDIKSENFKEVSSLLQCMRDNIAMWTST